MIASVIVVVYVLIGILLALLIEWRITSDPALYKYATEAEGLRPLTGKPGGIQKLCILFGCIWPVALAIVVYGAMSEEDDE